VSPLLKLPDIFKMMLLYCRVHPPTVS
jgi:hypothetical protein